MKWYPARIGVCKRPVNCSQPTKHAEVLLWCVGSKARYYTYRNEMVSHSASYNLCVSFLCVVVLIRSTRGFVGQPDNFFSSFTTNFLPLRKQYANHKYHLGANILRLYLNWIVHSHADTPLYRERMSASLRKLYNIQLECIKEGYLLGQSELRCFRQLEKLHSMNILWFLDLLPEVHQGKFLTCP